MRERSFIIVASVLAVLFVGAGALFVYDHTRRDRIAEGVRVGGVDVGGLSAREAGDRLDAAMRTRLEEAIVVRTKHYTFRLTPQAAALSFHVPRMVEAAVRRSRQGSIVTRTLRAVRGKPVEANLPATVTYSRLVVNRFVSRIARKVTRKPVDAHLEFTGDGFARAAGSDGWIVERPALHHRVTAALLGQIPSDPVRVPAHRVKPRVLKAELPREYPYLIVINRSGFKLRFYKHLHLVKTYPIAVGMAGLERAQQALGRQPRRPGHPRRRGQQPAQGTLAGDLQRRGDPRDRQHLVAGDCGVARMHPHGRPRRGGALRPGARADSGLHRLSLGRQLSPVKSAAADRPRAPERPGQAPRSARSGRPPIPALAKRRDSRRGEYTGCL